MPDAPPTAEVRAAVRAVAQGAAADLMDAGAQLGAGDLNLSAFALGARSTVKAAHLAATAAAAGGFGRLAPADVGRLGARLKGLYQGLGDLEFQHRSGSISAAMLAARAAGYVRAAMGTFENAVRERDRGEATEERRIIHSSHSCPECDAYASEGWVPVGTLPGVGDACSCRGNCLCSFEHR